MVQKKDNKSSKSNKVKVCRECGFITDKDVCPVCGSTKFTDKYKGEIYVFDVEGSNITKILGIKKKGRYALRY